MKVCSAVEEKVQIKVEHVRQYLIGIFGCDDRCIPRTSVVDIFNAVTFKKTLELPTLWSH